MSSGIQWQAEHPPPAEALVSERPRSTWEVRLQSADRAPVASKLMAVFDKVAWSAIETVWQEQAITDRAIKAAYFMVMMGRVDSGGFYS